MNSTKLIYLPLWILLSVTIFTCDQQARDEHDHANEPAGSIETHEDATHNDHGDEWILELSDSEVMNAGIKTIPIDYGFVPEKRRLYGEIQLNEERVIHKYPKYAGVVRDVRVNIGDNVRSGDTLAIVTNTSTLGLYPVIAAQSGEVLEKHAVIGEYVDGSEPIIVVGNLSSVWVDLHAFEKDLPLLHKGQSLTLYSIEGAESVQTSIQYIKPIMEAMTRTNIVRCIIDNRKRNWNPGRLVYGEVTTTANGVKALILPEHALQTVDEKQVVFVPESHDEFKVVVVQTGKRGAGLVEIIQGLEQGDEVVTEGSFFLKSELVTSSLSGHAGHGH
jgi:cobalt-zinc-cadmium efflux system membrane fusion protein